MLGGEGKAVVQEGGVWRGEVEKNEGQGDSGIEMVSFMG